MSKAQGPQFTAISAQLAQHMPTPGIDQDGIADAFRETLYAARDAGLLDSVSRLIEERAGDNKAVLALVEALRTEG